MKNRYDNKGVLHLTTDIMNHSDISGKKTNHGSGKEQNTKTLELINNQIS